MSLSIFWRLILSHVGILLLSGAACLYSVVQLDSLSATARSALDADHRMIDYQEALTDAFLSQVRYGGKYLITHGEGRREQMQQFKKDFSDSLAPLKTLGQTEQITASVTKIERFYGQYHELFDREAEYIRAKQNYAQTRYQQERNKIVETTLDELDRLKAQLRIKLQAKLALMEQRARTARRIAVLTTLVVLVFGAFLSLKVSKDFSTAGGEREEIQRAVVSGASKSLNRALELMRTSKDWARSRPGQWASLSFAAAWNRCSTFWKGTSARKGG
jgi:CHASE3 domain sensor protein